MYIENIIKFFKAKWIFFIPKHKDLLIIDYLTGKEILEYVDEKNLQFLHVRGESINLFILFKSLINCCFNKNKKISEEYYNNFILISKPKYVLTKNDVDGNFWKLKKNFKNVIFIVVQSANRGGSYDGNPFYHLKKNNKNKGYNVDYLFLLGSGFKKFYLKCFNVKKAVSMGSLRNNKIFNTKPKNSKNVVFVSQFKESYEKIKLLTQNGKLVSGEETYAKHDHLILKFLHNYCVKKNFRLNILCKTKLDYVLQKEKKHFDKIIGENSYIFLKTKNSDDTYKILNSYNFYVTIDSTLGYEILSRNKRVAWFDIRNSVSKLFMGSLNRYGSLARFPIQGPFWIHRFNTKKMIKIMDFITVGNSSSWKKVKKKYVDPIIVYDYNNKIFLNELNKIGIKLSKKAKRIIHTK